MSRTAPRGDAKPALQFQSTAEQMRDGPKSPQQRTAAKAANEEGMYRQIHADGNIIVAAQQHDSDARDSMAPSRYVVADDPTLPTFTRKIEFQDGPVRLNGVNGVTNEALLAMVADRLKCFQEGPYPCYENAAALEHVTAALEKLEERTAARKARGVKGTNQA